VPKATRLAVLWHSNLPGVRNQWEEAQQAAAVFGLEVISLPIASPAEIEVAFEKASAEGADMLLVLPDPLTLDHRERIVRLAAAASLPDAYGARDMVDAGGLFSLAADRFAMMRRSANYVDRILKGGNPTELPVEQPTRFELVINLRRARALDLHIPTQVLVVADDAID